MQEAKDPPFPPGTVDGAACTPLTCPIRYLLKRLTGTTGAPFDHLDPDGLREARGYGCIPEYQNRVAFTRTGAGAYHAEEITGGMLGG